MATIRKGNYLKGVLGPLVFRKVNGRQEIVTKPVPGQMKQTKATKRASGTFGLSSKLGARIRDAVRGQLTNFQDSRMNVRLVGELNSILQGCRDSETRSFDFSEQTFSRLAGFEFNTDSKVRNLMLQFPEVKADQKILSVHVPPLSIPGKFKFPQKSFFCGLNISVSLFRLKDGKMAVAAKSQHMEIYRYPELSAAAEFKFDLPEGCLCITTISLKYAVAEEGGRRFINNKRFNPVCILGALFTTGTYGEPDDNQWTGMVKFP
ncbi:MAG TPA: hypothetical protein VGC08_04470 [Pedobacter sp.]